jgi:hypothetical protein
MEPAQWDVMVPPGESNGLVILFDSIGATPTEAEVNPKKNVDGTEKESPPAEFARRMSKFQRRFLRMSSERDVLIVYSNKLTDKIGVTFGKRTTTYGGNAIRFHCALRFEVIYTGKLKDSKKSNVGMTMKIVNVKNKCEIPWQQADGIEYHFTDGFNSAFSLLQIMKDKKLVKKTGSKYKGPWGDEEMKRGEFMKYVKENPEKYDEFTKMINESNREDLGQEKLGEDEE